MKNDSHTIFLFSQFSGVVYIVFYAVNIKFIEVILRIKLPWSILFHVLGLLF